MMPVDSGGGYLFVRLQLVKKMAERRFGASLAEVECQLVRYRRIEP